MAKTFTSRKKIVVDLNEARTSAKHTLGAASFTNEIMSHEPGHLFELPAKSY